MFYTGAKFGRTEPFASLRLKAYRWGQQDIEYLVLLAQTARWDRDAVSHAMGGDAVRDRDLDALRARVTAVLSRSPAGAQ